jgi:hypothetical protein
LAVVFLFVQRISLGQCHLFSKKKKNIKLLFFAHHRFAFSIDELVQNGKNGRVFETADDLKSQLQV